MKNKLVVDIGSGHKPSPYADILLDIKDDSGEHKWNQNLKIDRPTILYDGKLMPFKNKVFNFSICKHTLEHVEHPNAFLQEIQRISNSGYIETPSETTELVFTPYDKHLWVINLINNELIIRRKNNQNITKTGKLFDYLIDKNSKLENELYLKHEDLFLVKYYWSGKINFKFISERTNPLTDYYCDINLAKITKENKLQYSLLEVVKHYFFRLKREFKKIKLEEILMCPECKSDITFRKDKFVCTKCAKKYEMNNQLLDFTNTNLL